VWSGPLDDRVFQIGRLSHSPLLSLRKGYRIVSNNQKPQPSLNKIIGMEAYPPKTRSLGTHLAINRPPSDNFRILRRAWAGFAMEAAYWDSLHDICTVKNITHYELVAQGCSTLLTELPLE
jgi:hypothetical protein